MRIVPREKAAQGLTGEGTEIWRKLSAGSAGQPLELLAAAALQIQAVGAMGAGQVEMQASNVPSPVEDDWTALPMPNGIPLAFNEPGFRHTDASPRWVRPCVINGDEATNVSVFIVMRKVR